ncbi:tripartite tricarboxylate transporter TctB family protein [Kaistia terrae]|uniref:Tripartite tricarboxylate transporter TctB family protein n=1 Tax=Kaistia terrae TaxID=537017 RepID=A0ABW0Q0V4_9HYPH|nr:tripartite tricarboxylate transporter TctB family protein [Kaistia terrae]MCX5578672.1 tripartite tricarboxylate transporter TctB family protein [Kaistia terrae]
MIKLSELHLGILAALGGIVLLFASANFAPLPGQAYGAGTMPRLIGWCAILLGCFMVATSLKHLPEMAKPHLADWVRKPRLAFAALACLAVIVFYILFAETLGFLPTSFLGLLALMLVLRTKWPTAILASLATTLAVYYAFSRLLMVPLPRTEFLSFLG